LRRLKVLNADNELDPFWRENTRMPVDPRFGSQARRRLRRHLPAALGRSRRLVGSGDGGVRRTALDTPSRDPGGIQVTRVQRERQAVPRGAPVLVSSGPSFVAGSLPETGRSRTAASGRTETLGQPAAPPAADPSVSDRRARHPCASTSAAERWARPVSDSGGGRPRHGLIRSAADARHGKTAGAILFGLADCLPWHQRLSITPLHCMAKNGAAGACLAFACPGCRSDVCWPGANWARTGNAAAKTNQRARLRDVMLRKAVMARLASGHVQRATISRTIAKGRFWLEQRLRRLRPGRTHPAEVASLSQGRPLPRPLWPVRRPTFDDAARLNQAKDPGETSPRRSWRRRAEPLSSLLSGAMRDGSDGLEAKGIRAACDLGGPTTM